MTNLARFTCPTCSALYQVMRVEADPADAAVDREISCTVCREPLRGRDGRFIFKYFLVRRPGEAERPNYVRPTYHVV